MLLLCCLSLVCHAQTDLSASKGSVVGLKTNIPYWGTATFNAGVEFRLAKKWTLDIEAGLNPFDGKNDDGSYDKSLKHLRVHPDYAIGSAKVFTNTLSVYMFLTYYII